MAEQRISRPPRRRMQLMLSLALLAAMGLMAGFVQPALGQDNNVEIHVGGPGQVRSVSAPNNLVNPPTGMVTTLTFNTGDWQGGWHRNDSGFLGRPWTAIYGAQSKYPQASLTFNLTATPTNRVMLTLVGISDETGVKDQIRVTINGRNIYTGPAWFANWDGNGNGQNAVWTTVDITMPGNYFQQGTNQITVANLHPGSNFSSPPWVDLGAAQLVVPGVGAFLGK